MPREEAVGEGVSALFSISKADQQHCVAIFQAARQQLDRTILGPGCIRIVALAGFKLARAQFSRLSGPQIFAIYQSRLEDELF